MPQSEKSPLDERPSVPGGSALRHGLFSAALWITFVVYWNLVLGRGVGGEARTTVLILTLFIVLQTLLTIGWVAHNRRLARRFAGRRRARSAVSRRVTTDFLGRRLEFDPADFDLASAPVIRIRVDGEVKRFETRLALGEARSATGN